MSLTQNSSTLHNLWHTVHIHDALTNGLPGRKVYLREKKHGVRKPMKKPKGCATILVK